MYKIYSATPKRFYASLISKCRWNFYLWFVIFASIVFLSVCVLMFLWNSNELVSFLQLSTALSHAASAKPVKITYTVIVSVFLLFFLWVLNNKRKFLRKLKKERKIMKGQFSDEVSELIYKFYIQTKIQKNTVFWTFFSFACLGVIAIIYSFIVSAVGKFSGSFTAGLIQASYWKKIIPTNPDEIVFFSGVCAFFGSCVLMLLSKKIFLKKIARIENTYSDSLDCKYDRIKDVVEIANKKSKAPVMFIICIIGFPIYLIFKKIIITVFKKH